MSAVADERAAASAALDSANERLAALCQSHSATFVAVEKRNQKIAGSLKSLLDKLPATETTREVLQKNALGDLTERHRIRRRTLLQHASLLELLELPVILDACVRSQMYDEALQIAAFSTQQLHKEDSPIIQNVVKEIKSRQNDLRHHLLARLKTTVSMPECLEVITAIRRLNTIELENTMEDLEYAHEMSEYKLAVDFLEARDMWLESTNHSTVMDAMEAYRTRVFAIATQYNAIFPSYENLLALWLSRRIQRYLGLLESLDKNCVEIRDALEAVLFFGSSLGRLGAEFTAMLDLKPALVKTVTAPWKQAVQQLSATLQICRDASVVGPLQSDAVVSGTGTEEEDDTSPPKILLQTPPLARLVNGILEGLNELRRCLLPDSFVALRRELNVILLEAADTLKEHQRSAFGSLRQNAEILSEFFRSIVDPYCRGALETTLGFDARSRKFYKTMREGIVAATKVDDPDNDEGVESKKEEDAGDVEQKSEEENDESKGGVVRETVEDIEAPNEQEGDDGEVNLDQ